MWRNLQDGSSPRTSLTSSDGGGIREAFLTLPSMKGEVSSEASNLVKRQKLVADKLKDQGIGEPKSSSLELEYKQC